MNVQNLQILIGDDSPDINVPIVAFIGGIVLSDVS